MEEVMLVSIATGTEHDGAFLRTPLAVLMVT
jgi:hypothetical protein